MFSKMSRWPFAGRFSRVFPCLIADTKRRISINTRINAGDGPTGNSFQPIKLAYSSFESVNSLDLSSTPIIIMHGLLGSKQNWNSLSNIIHNKTKRKVITVDARNHGDSPHTSEMSYPLMADDVRQLMIDLNIPKATVIGHSMGGRTMMFMSLKYPELVDQLIVVDISPIRDSPNMKTVPSYLHALQEVKLIPNQPLSAAREEANRQLLPYVKEKSVRQFFLANLVETENGTFRWKMNIDALLSQFHELASFPAINAVFNGPTCFIGGAESDFILQEDHDGIRKYFPRSIFEYIEGAGHWLHAEKPIEFLEIVCKFLIEKA